MCSLRVIPVSYTHLDVYKRQRLGFPVLDPIASVVICVFIVKAAYDIFKDAIDKMVDKSCDEETEEKMRRLIEEQQGVLKVDVLRTRLFGAKMYVDIEIAADGDITLREGHEIAQVVHDKVEEEFPLVKHCMVHVNPCLLYTSSKYQRNT